MLLLRCFLGTLSVFNIHDHGATNFVVAHGGHELPQADCFKSNVICWSRKFRNELAPHFFSMPVPPAQTHDLLCERQSEPEFRAALSDLFRDPHRTSVRDVHNFVHRNIEEIESLVLTWDNSYGAMNPESMLGKDTITLNRTECYLAYLSGKLLSPFADEHADILSVTLELKRHVFNQFWFTMLNWIDIARTQWPVLIFFEFLSISLRRVYSGSHREAYSKLGVQIDHDSRGGDLLPDDLRVSVLSPSPPWATIAARFFALEREVFATAAGHLCLVLQLLDSSSSQAVWQSSWAISLALSWIRAAPKRPTPLLQLLLSAWPVLTLWNRIWKHPRSSDVMVRSEWCPAVFDPIWDIRRLDVDAKGRALPGGMQQFLRPLEEMPQITNDAEVPRDAAGGEAWATTIAVPADVASAEGKAWIQAVRVLHASVRKHEPPGKRRPFVVGVESGMNPLFARTLERDGMMLKVLEPIIIPEHLAECPSVQRRAEGLRFRLFGLTEFERIIYIDADAMVVGPMSHLFDTPKGVQFVATVNSTRWLYPTLLGYAPSGPVASAGFQNQRYRRMPGAIQGVSMLNTGVMVITPWAESESIFVEPLDASECSLVGGWASCNRTLRTQHGKVGASSLLINGPGIFAAYCTQGLIDAALLAQNRRLGHAVWNGKVFSGCLAPPDGSGLSGTVFPEPWVHHCTLDESFNLQVTRPHLDWHFDFLRKVRALSLTGDDSSTLHVVHWPGRPKPWKLGIGQRSVWEKYWWQIHAEVCAAGKHEKHENFGSVCDPSTMPSAACDQSALRQGQPFGNCLLHCG